MKDSSANKKNLDKFFAQAISKFSSSVVFQLSPLGIIEYLNPAIEKLHGFKPEELIGRHFKEVTPLSEMPKAMKAVKSILFGNTVENFQLKQIRKDETIFFVEIDAVPVKEDGKVIGLLGVLKDITPEKIVQEQLENSERKFRQLFNNMKNGVAVYKVKGKGKDFIFSDFNKAAEIIDNIKKEEVIGKEVREVFPGVEEFGLLGVFREVWKTGKPILHPVSEYKDGRIRGWRKNYVYKLPSGDIVSIYEDMTDEKKKEATLKSSEERFSAVVEHIGIGIALISPEMEILFLNKQMKNWFPHARTRKRNICFKLFNNPPRKKPCSYCPTIKTLEDGEIHEDITKTPTTDGYVNYRIVSSPIRDVSGKITAAIEMVEDITEKRKAQENLRNAYAKLKEAQSQLIQADKMEAIGILASSVAHEVKNPLAIILQGVNYLERKYDFEEEILSKIKDNVKRADKIIKGLVNFSRKAELDIKPSDIHSIIKNSLGLITHELKKKRINITKEFDEKLPKVSLDKNKIEQVFINLFINAIQAIDKDGNIYIRTYKTKINKSVHKKGRRKTDFFRHGEGVVCVEIEDTGSGIAKEHIDKLFDPFFSTKREGVGTGLGLSVTKNIIDLHKGDICIESTVGKGTKVTICFKIAEKI